jgi:hypothetical protein
MKSGINPSDINLSKFFSDGNAYSQIEDPFEFKAKDFLDFASEDLKGKSVRDTVNALGNIKRSIDCLFDSLLFVVNFLKHSKRKRWTFPEKMNFLGEIGIITPDILSRINSTRNLLEHEFKKPKRADVETAYDVAVLLYYATVRFTKEFVSDMCLAEEGEEDSGIRLIINRERRKIDILPAYEKKKFASFSVTWDENPDEYKKWLHLIYQVQYNCI